MSARLARDIVFAEESEEFVLIQPPPAEERPQPEPFLLKGVFAWTNNYPVD